MARIIVTAYTNPDLDGTACAVAYAELLTKQGKDAIGAVFGTLHQETEFVLNAGNIPAPAHAEDEFDQSMQIILVDASETGGISSHINPAQVIEVVDHRKVNTVEVFSHAKVQIEMVGSCATLIAEKFYESQTPISPDAALLLYAAIISNTINFQASVTTERDKKMAEWLQTCTDVSPNFIHDMFVAKSQLTKPLKEYFVQEFALTPMGNVRMSIVQLEIVDAQKVLTVRIDEIKQLLSELKQEHDLEMIFLTIVDIEKATNDFVVIDEKTQRLMEQTLSVTFTDGIAHREGILMRKQIIPMIRETLGIDEQKKWN